MSHIRAKTKSKIGRKFNRLTFESVAWNDTTESAIGTFSCDCGNTYTGNPYSVFTGNTKSCGCLARDILNARNHKHGMARSKIYQIWADMVARCVRPTHKRWSDYGGRGITVSEDWLNFEAFYRDMGDRPHGCSLDRVDNNLGYSASNCRWATSHEQATNKRNNRYLEAFGFSLPITWWGQLIGMGSSDLGRKLKSDLSLEDIVVARVGLAGAEYIWSHS